MGPDDYAPKKTKEARMNEILSNVDRALSYPEEPLKVIGSVKAETKRDIIADLIRGLTYRELCQMGDELLKKRAPKNAPDGIDMPQTLDDWAHWVLEGETDVNKQGTQNNKNKDGDNVHS